MGEHTSDESGEIRTSSVMSSQPDDDGGDVRQSDASGDS
jgi:hypothetical protein